MYKRQGKFLKNTFGFASDLFLGTDFSDTTILGATGKEIGDLATKYGVGIGGGSTKQYQKAGRAVTQAAYQGMGISGDEDVTITDSDTDTVDTGTDDTGTDDIDPKPGYWEEGGGFEKHLGWLASGATIWQTHEMIKSQSDFGRQMSALSSQTEASYHRFQAEQAMKQDILNTPREELRDRFSDTTLMSYGITPDLADAEALQERDRIRAEAQDYEDVSGRAAARAGMFGSGVLGAYAQQQQLAQTGQDAALGLAAEKTFAGQLMNLRQQYATGQVQSIQMEEAQIARQIAGAQAAQQGEQGMYSLLIPTLQKIAERTTPPKD